MKVINDFFKNTQSAICKDYDVLESNNTENEGHQEISQAKKSKADNVIFNYDQLVEMTDGKMSIILGDEYIPLDNKLIRNRMPSPPFMFVTRVIEMNAKRGIYKKSSIEIEYDIPEEIWNQENQ